MEFTRSKYDNCNNKSELGKSTGIYNYTMNNIKYINNNTCSANVGLFSPITRQMPVSKMIDFENDITGRKQKLSKCANNNYTPNCSYPRSGNFCDEQPQSYVLNECSFIKPLEKPTYLGYKL
jgi:hypothetical protein